MSQDQLPPNEDNVFVQGVKTNSKQLQQKIQLSICKANMNGTCSCNAIADEMPIFSNNHPLNFYSHTHCIFTTDCIFTHSLYSQTSTLFSPNLSVFTKSLYTHLLSIYSPTHSMFTYSLYIRSTKFIVGVKTKTSQKFKQFSCTLSIYGMHTQDNGSRVN